MSNQSEPLSQQQQLSTPMPDPHEPASSAPTSSPTHSGEIQQGASHPLPISPFTGEPFNPEWGVIIREVDGDPRTIQQVMKPEVERKMGE